MCRAIATDGFGEYTKDAPRVRNIKQQAAGNAMKRNERASKKEEIVYVIRKKSEDEGREGRETTGAHILGGEAATICLVLPAAQTLFVAYPSRRCSVRRFAS